MIARLVLGSIRERPGRSLLLLAGYALGVGVTVALLSIGDALVESSRDRTLIGGGDVTVLPAGIDLETLRTGGTSALFFGVDQAPFLYREVLAGPRLADRVAAAAPWIEGALLYLDPGTGPVAVSADGQIPGRAAALGVEPRLLRGRWRDVAADRAWTAPSDSALLASLDGFHDPPAGLRDTTWAEWHYFNVSSPDGEEWLYLTFMVTGDVGGSRRGRVLATRVRRGGEARRFVSEVAPGRVAYREDRPDLLLGPSRVTLDGEGRYRLRAEAPGFRASLRVTPAPRRYLPPLDVSPGDFPSGYVVPVLRGRADGELCVDGDCRPVRGARAYHDHNWGTWRRVTWDWGEGRAGPYSILYGGVARAPAAPAGAEGTGEVGEPGTYPERGERFLFLTDSLGFLGAFRVDSMAYGGSGPSPDRIRLRATRGDERLSVDVEVEHALRTVPEGADAREGPVFHQMKGRLRLRGRVLGAAIEGRGSGFFETWTGPGSGRRGRVPDPARRAP